MDILIRTSGRPNYFKRCVESIKNKKGIRLLVSTDTNQSYLYADQVLKESGIPYVIVKTQKGYVDNYWNLYLNELLELARGWVWILDDDDTIVNMNFNLKDKDTVYIYKIDYLNRELPEPEYWGTITECHIGMVNFIFHKDNLKTKFDGKRKADYRFLKDLSTYRKIEWVNKVIAKVDAKGWGKDIDLPAKIDFVVPYAFDKNLGAEYNRIFEHSNADYVCIMDGDILFFHNDFGHFISRIISKYPDGAIYTCLTNRIGNPEQRESKYLNNEKNILKHKRIAEHYRKKNEFKVVRAKKRTSMLVSVISKKVWNEIRFKEGLLGVDWDFSQKVLDKGYPIYIMQGLYVFHLYRLGNGGVGYTKHLE